jgi:hypothetical protein
MRAITAAATASGRPSAIALAADRATTRSYSSASPATELANRVDSANDLASSHFLEGFGQLLHGPLVGQ